MTKQMAVNFCRLMLQYGIYCMPVYDLWYQDWTVKVNHPDCDWVYSNMTRIWGLTLQDHTYSKHDDIQDYGLYFSMTERIIGVS